MLQSFRPILLLNCDYKILTTVLANRLNRVLKFIHPDQVGFIKNRNLRDSTRRLCNIIDYLQIPKIPAILHFSEAEKAFDQVHWGFLKKALLKMGTVKTVMVCKDHS